MKHLYGFINNPGHMTKMATLPTQGENPPKKILSGTAESIEMKLDISVAIGTRVLQ